VLARPITVLSSDAFYATFGEAATTGQSRKAHGHMSEGNPQPIEYYTVSA